MKRFFFGREWALLSVILKNGRFVVAVEEYKQRSGG